jgi:hypothetical protein
MELDVPILYTYEVVSAVYDPLLEILTSGPLVHDSYPNGTKFFKNDAVHLSFPAKGPTERGNTIPNHDRGTFRTRR